MLVPTFPISSLYYSREHDRSECKYSTALFSENFSLFFFLCRFIPILILKGLSFLLEERSIEE